jgi:hypothetical protein
MGVDLVKITVRLPRAVVQELWAEKLRTRTPVEAIAGAILARHYRARERKAQASRGKARKAVQS